MELADSSFGSKSHPRRAETTASREHPQRPRSTLIIGDALPVPVLADNHCSLRTMMHVKILEVLSQPSEPRPSLA